jgi:hypothetical protein
MQNEVTESAPEIYRLSTGDGAAALLSLAEVLREQLGGRRQ